MSGRHRVGVKERMSQSPDNQLLKREAKRRSSYWQTAQLHLPVRTTHTPSIAFRHFPPKEGCRKPVLGVCSHLQGSSCPRFCQGRVWKGVGWPRRATLQEQQWGNIGTFRRPEPSPKALHWQFQRHALTQKDQNQHTRELIRAWKTYINATKTRELIRAWKTYTNATKTRVTYGNSHMACE